MDAARAMYRMLVVAAMLVAPGCGEAGPGAPDLPPDAGRVGLGVRIEGNIGGIFGSPIPDEMIVGLFVELAGRPRRYRVHAVTVATSARYTLDVAGVPAMDTFQPGGYARGSILVLRTTTMLPPGIQEEDTVSSALIGASASGENIIYKRAGASGTADPWLADFPDDSWACGGRLTTTGGVSSMPLILCSTIDLAVAAR